MNLNDRILDEEIISALAAGETDLMLRLRLLADVLTDAMPQMVWATDADGAHFFYNHRWYEYTGLTPEESMGFGFAKALHPDDVERTLAHWRRAWAEGADYEIEYRFVRRSTGEARWFVGRAMPVRSRQSGKIVMWVGTCTDIHDQKQTEARLKAALERETIQNRIAEALRRGGTPGAVLHTACREIADALDCARVWYTDIDQERGTALVDADYRRDPTLISVQGSYPLSGFGEPIIGELRAGRTVLVCDTQTDPRTAPFYSAFAAIRTGAFISVPLLRNGRWVAALAAAVTEASHPWSEEDTALLETVAGQTQAVLELAQENARERRTAQAFQDTVSPPARPQMGSYRFASYYAAALQESAIGGDFYDQFELPDGRIGLVIGDVSGKGLAAAVQTALVKFTLRGFAMESADTGTGGPGLVLTRLNRALFLEEALTGFVTLCYVALDPTAGKLTYASAGHEPPVLCRTDRCEETLLPPTGPILGVGPDIRYEEENVPFQNGDRLLLYTDGLTEANRISETGEEELLGTTRVAELLCEVRAANELPEAALARLLRGAQEFAGAGFRDDLALLLVDFANG